MKREEQIFEQVIALPSPEAREAYLREVCAQDRDLRRRVDELLGAFQDAEQMAFLRTGERSIENQAITDSPLAEGPGTRIGRYKLLEQIGEGGFGVVFMAEQEEPVRRKVALKIIKLGMDTKQVIARFEAERQALALMDHPNIAKVLDAGATETGGPYFVMELVKGVPITQFSDKNKLLTRDRLKLFIAVCQAIQHAHQKGIIHRDIKPSNILVTLEHGEPVPKVIDFGIVKAVNQRLTEKTLFTNFAQMIGTPAYMSPEQAEMSSLDIDTRTDVYSLGVLLYELLTGTTPITKERLQKAGYAEMQRLIREEEAERPSTRVTKVTVGTGSIPFLTGRESGRGGDPLRTGNDLLAALRSDLDWIAMKALEKDRRRRYETPNELLADVQRYLHDEPILAKPPSRLYRFQKMVRRNKLACAAAITVAASLILGIAAATWQAVKARQAEQQALTKQQEALKAKASEAQLRRKAEAESYTSDMNLVLERWQEGNLKTAQELLRAHIPKAGDRDLRGFEWRYLWKLCQDESLHTNTIPAGTRDAIWDRRLTTSPTHTFVAAGGEKDVWLLDPTTGRELQRLPSHNGNEAGAAFHRRSFRGDQSPGHK